MRAFLTFALASLTLCACATSASAYRLNGGCERGTVRYANTIGPYAADVREAVAAWNTSGAAVRFVRVPRRDADLVIRYASGLRKSGITYAGCSRTGRVRGWIGLRRGLKGVYPPEIERGARVAHLVAHELGHALGLGHEDRFCATMNTDLLARCSDRPETWEIRCGILHRDDIAGVVRRYGGFATSPGPSMCELSDAPPPPLSLRAGRDGLGRAVLAVTGPREAVAPVRVRVLRGGAACPVSPDDGAEVTELVLGAGESATVLDAKAGATARCYSAWSLGEDDHPSQTAVSVRLAAATSRRTTRGGPRAAAWYSRWSVPLKRGGAA